MMHVTYSVKYDLRFIVYFRNENISCSLKYLSKQTFEMHCFPITNSDRSSYTALHIPLSTNANCIWRCHFWYDGFFISFSSKDKMFLVKCLYGLY